MYSEEEHKKHQKAELLKAAQRWEEAAKAVLAGDKTIVCNYETCLRHAAECHKLAEEQ